LRTIITGAASGIGAEVAGLLAHRADAAEGASLLLVDRDHERLLQVAAGCGKAAATFVQDLAAADCGDRIVSAACDSIGGVDALVSNAGMIAAGTLAELETADFDRVFAVNLRATWLIAKASYPHLKRSGRGSIVATASIAASHATPGLGAYAASKAALVMLVKQLANEWGPDGIRCNCVSPGPTLTGLTATTYADPERARKRTADLPLRHLGQPRDIANAIIFLLGGESSQITGVDLLVDGGLSTTLMKTAG